MANPSKITLTDAKLQDLAVSGINTTLATRLPWMTTFYGAAVKKPNEKGFYPATETNSDQSKKYLSLFPDTKLGTFSFWDIVDGSPLEKKGDFLFQRFEAGFVVWGDLRTVYGNTAWKANNVQNVLWDVAEAIKGKNFGTSSVEIRKIYLESVNIYRGYTSQEQLTQHLMRPFFGFRIQCDVVHKQFCP